MKSIHILLAEDDAIAAFITKETLSNVPFPYTLSLVNDGEEAIAYLEKRGAFKEAVTPDVVILDLNMPNKDGLEVLKEMRLQPHLVNTPVLILTTSSAQRDIDKTFQANASCYITKPFNEQQLIKAIDIIRQTWLPA